MSWPEFARLTLAALRRPKTARYGGARSRAFPSNAYVGMTSMALMRRLDKHLVSRNLRQFKATVSTNAGKPRRNQGSVEGFRGREPQAAVVLGRHYRGLVDWPVDADGWIIPSKAALVLRRVVVGRLVNELGEF